MELQAVRLCVRKKSQILWYNLKKKIWGYDFFFQGATHTAAPSPFKKFEAEVERIDLSAAVSVLQINLSYKELNMKKSSILVHQLIRRG